jgi:hypothetical protein
MVKKDLNHIHPCTTRPHDTNNKTFIELFKNDIYKIMNTCNQHTYNLTCAIKRIMEMQQKSYAPIWIPSTFNQ